ncbi:MAG: VOC family protein [Chloroflexota bacterium]|jgi:PhnB protein
MATINPYLTFDGNCEEAFDFYRSVFGGDFDMMQRFSEAPPEMPVASEDANKVMHVSLPLGDGQVLMGSDQPSERGPLAAGSSISLHIGVDSAEEGRRLFEALAAGGTVVMPYEPQFWGSDYGMCADRFGTVWAIDYAHPQEG